MTHRPVVAILGATASGKSSLALFLAARFPGEILNCDSLQMVRYFDIGSAKVPVEERQGIRHHFLDILEPDEQFAAGEYMRQARAVLDEVSARGKLPIVVGGTGFYLRALLEGLFPGPKRSPELRARLRRRAQQKSSAYMHRLLRRLDAAAASRIHPNDSPKLIRAVEVCLLARRPVTELFGQGRPALENYSVLKLGLNPPREALYAKINERAQWMFDHGLMEEVRGILRKGYPPDLPPFRSHGYRQAVDFLEGKISLEEAIYHAQTRTRQYAKRQMTWFRREAQVHWFAGFGDNPAVQQQACALVAALFAAPVERAQPHA
jgi:tRNA dimethylallyltransferase